MLWNDVEEFEVVLNGKNLPNEQDELHVMLFPSGTQHPECMKKAIRKIYALTGVCTFTHVNSANYIKCTES